MSEKTNTKTVIVTALATAIGAAAGSYAVKGLFNESIDINDQLIKTAEEVNKMLPMTLDSETRLDSTIGLNGTFTYNYTLTNYNADEIDREIFQTNMAPKVLNNYCTSDDMKQFLEKDITVNFTYFGKEGKQVLKLTYQPKDCQKG